MKKINIIINIFIAVFIGVFIGHGVYTVWDFKTHPELYVVQSAPWYTSIYIWCIDHYFVTDLHCDKSDHQS